MPAERHNARDIAVEALRDRAGNVSAHLERLLAAAVLSHEDRALARELALGTLRRRRTLKAVLSAFLARPGQKLPVPLEEVLLVGLHQVLFLERIPVFAAVSQAVEQAARLHHRRQTGLVNGVLRSVTRSLGPVQRGDAPMTSNVLPIGPGLWRTLERPVCADPQSDLPNYVADAYSLPTALVERWLERLGTAQTLRLAMQANVRAPLVARVNRLRADVAAVLEKLSAQGAQAQAHPNGVGVIISQGPAVTELAAFKEGLIQPQDATAMAVALACAPAAGQNVLDLCAAPGTKTTHLAELMDNAGSVLALDVSDEKLEMIRSNCRRLGVAIVRTGLAQEAGGLDPASFDLVLADVPCSNTGVLARRPEARWRFDPAALGELVRSQVRLGVLGASFVKPGGRLIYSTCSIEPQECGQVAAEVTQRSGLRIQREQLTLPSFGESPADWCDGGYWAELRR
jgi:16S rRNA (cytosine967-C5)-methyltransferase